MQFSILTLKLFLKIHNHIYGISYIENKSLENIKHNNLMVLAYFIINECKESYFKEL